MIILVRHVLLHVMAVMMMAQLLQTAKLAKRLELILMTVRFAQMGIIYLVLETAQDPFAQLAISHVTLAPRVLSPRTVLETVNPQC